MRDTAKVFMNGRSQAVRLPAQYRFETDEVFVTRDATTGNIILSPKPRSWEGFFERLDSTEVPDDFLTDRDNELPRDRELFE